MASEDLGITAIAGALAERMPTRGVPEGEAKQAIRSTLHYAKDVGIMEQLTDRIEAEAEGDTQVTRLCESLREK